MPEKVPLWVLQNTFQTFGRRMPPMPETLPKTFKTCETCKKELYKITDWEYCDEKYYCKDHIEEPRKEQAARWAREREEREKSWERNRNRGYLRGFADGGYAPAPVTLEESVPIGNLEEGEYQYWIGTLSDSFPRHLSSARAVCRACGYPVHGKLGREAHKRESTNFYSGGHSCLKVIAMAIRDMVHLTKCFICNSYTNRKNYGVPICSPQCLKAWRFDENRVYPELDREIAKYWMTGQTSPGTGGSSTSGSSSNPTTIVSEEQE